MKQYFIFLLVVLSPVLLLSQSWSEAEFYSYHNDPAFQPRQQDVDFVNIKCEAFIDGPKNYIDATATMTFKTFYHLTDSISVRTAKLNVQDVSIDGQKTNWKWNPQKTEIIIYPKQKFAYNTTHDLVIKYDAYPHGGLHFTGWQDDEKHKYKQIWAHSLGYWCPYSNIKHDLVITEMLITFDENYQVFSNGRCLSEKSNGDGTKTWHYKISAPHVVYLPCLMIGDFGVRKFKTDRGVELEYLYFKDMPERFDIAYKYSKDIFNFYEEETGTPYPWELYRNMPAEDYLFGGMETTTSTVFGGYMYVDERAWWMRNFVNVNAHELAHQWFGNYVSNINKEIWLAESFPTYYAKIFEQSVFGDDYYQWVRDQEFDLTWEDARKNSYPVAHSRGGRGRYYMKGSLVLDMLRDQLGDEGFKAAIKHYLAENKHQVVSYDDFLRAIREATGESLEWFFEQWIRRGGEPHFKISWEKVPGFINLDVEQIHKIGNLTGYFKVPVEIQVYFKNGDTQIFNKEVNGAYTKLKLDNPQNLEVDFIVFDANRKLIKKVTFERSIHELAQQAIRAENMIDKVDAVRAMKGIPLNKKISAFVKAYPTGKYHLFRGEIIKQIIADDNYYKNEDALNIVKKAINSGDELVIRQVVKTTKRIPDVLRKDYEILLQDSCYRNVELALEDLCYSFPKNTKKYLNQTKDEIGWQGKNIRIKWLEIAINAGQKKYLKELKDYSSPNYEFKTRINAFHALKRLNHCDMETAYNLARGWSSWHFQINNAAKEVIKYFIQQDQYRPLFDQLLKSDKLEDWEKAKLNGLL